MAFEFKLPDIGEGVVEGEIVKWLVKPGDAVAVDQPMVEVMTDKATVVIPSPRAGTIRETRGAEGEIVQVHAVLVVIDESGAGVGPSAERPAAVPPPVPQKPVATPSAAVHAPTPKSTVIPEPQRAPAPVVMAAQPGNGTRMSEPAQSSHQDKVLAAPATRRLARELGVDLRSLSGSGPAGRITSDDVRRTTQSVPSSRGLTDTAIGSAIAAPKAMLSLDVTAEDERVPVRGVRKRIWENMVRSKHTATHFTFVEECDMTELVALRARLNDQLKDGEPRLTYLPFIVKAVTTALREFPDLNAHVDDARGEYVRRGQHHIGIAAATDRGLIVPVVRNASQRSLLSIASEIARMGDAARAGKIGAEDLGGSTFTITSLGKEGGIFATPIINYPEVAIMGVHKMTKRPVVIDDQIVAREMMNLSLSFDHRLIDGHVGAAFTYAVIDLLQKPHRLMLLA